VVISISMRTDVHWPANSYGTSWWTIDTPSQKATTGRVPPSSLSRDMITTLREIVGVRRSE
jgi:hypothetical protein